MKEEIENQFLMLQLALDVFCKNRKISSTNFNFPAVENVKEIYISGKGLTKTGF